MGGLTFTPRTTSFWVAGLGVALWFASQNASEHPTYATVAGLAVLLFSAEFVRRQ